MYVFVLDSFCLLPRLLSIVKTLLIVVLALGTVYTHAARYSYLDSSDNSGKAQKD